MQLSSRLIITIVLIQTIAVTTLVWNSGRIIKVSQTQQLENTYSAEMGHLIDTLSIGLIYADRAMLAESLSHMESRADISYAIVYDRKNRTMASTGNIPDNPSQMKTSISYADSIDSGTYHRLSKISKKGQHLGALQIGFSTDQVKDLMVSGQRQNIIIAMITFFITIVASLLLGRYITSNLRLLELGVEHFSEGNFNYRIRKINDTAIDDVANAFNTLADDLQITIDELNERNSSLLESESQVRMLLDSTAEAIFGLDIKGNCTFANPASVRMLGYQTAEELIGRNMHRLIHHKHSDGSHYPDNECLILNVLQTGDRNHDDTEVFWRADGNSFPAEYWSYPTYLGNKLTGAVVTFLDITDRRAMDSALLESERRYRGLIDSSPDFVWELNSHSIFTYASPRVYKILGYRPDEVIGITPFELMDPDEAKRVGAIFEEFSSKKEPLHNLEITHLHKDGHAVIIEMSGSPMLNDDGELVGYRGSGRDVTEQKAAETEHVRMQNELQQSHKMESLGQLTGGIAHDFNNLLGIINGFAKLALDKYANIQEDSLVEYMRNIKEAGERASNLVAQMLAFSRGDQADDIPINFASVLKEDIKMLRATLPSTIAIKSHIDQSLPLVLMNPTQLHQILMNLTVNARDAMNGAGELTIQLGWAKNLDTESSVSHKPIKGDWIELCFNDTGTGIDAEVAKSIFNPFFTTKEVGKGTGMGLSMIYRIMENHNGHILLESELGKGTSFRLLFAPIEEEIHLEESLPESKNIPLGDGSEILVVDDEPMLGFHMPELVKDHGYRATVVTDGEEALDLFKQDPQRFSILITDQTMPKLTGTELTEKVRELRPELPVIMCTGYSDKIDANGAAGMDIPYFTKPVDVDKILLKISELLNL